MTFSRPATVALDIAAWAAIHGLTGYLVHRMPAARFDRDGWLWRERSFEARGDLYVGAFRIKKWKRRLPEAGDVFPGGFDKRHLHGGSRKGFRAFIRETRRAELGHWLAMLPAPLFFLWNPAPVGFFMVAIYAPLANGPCILAQRYNRIRLNRVLRNFRKSAP